MAVYVISDLHVGAGPLDDCDAGCEDALVAFISWLASGADDEPELVLNGDSFDFVQAEPWQGSGLEAVTVDGVPLCFDQRTSEAKAQAILASHDRIFSACAALLRRPGAQLTILPGNHDADLFWDPVRAAVAARLGPSERLVWHMERMYMPKRAPHVLIEHGHQYDPLNSFFHPGTTPPTEHWGNGRRPVLTDTEGHDRLIECIGTRFLIRFLNGLDRRYPFVDNIKPFDRFLSVFGSSLRTFRGGTVRAALSTLAFARFVATDALSPQGNLLSAAVESGDQAGAALASIEAASAGHFSEVLREAAFDFRGRSLALLLKDEDEALRVLDFCLAHVERFDDVVLESRTLSAGGRRGDESEEGMLSLRKGMRLDETQLLKDAARDLLKTPGVRCVVMGHTHEAVDEPAYKNIGSWTRYWQMTSDEPTPPWPEMVKRASTLPLSPRYAVASGNPAEPVRLVDFK